MEDPMKPWTWAKGLRRTGLTQALWTGKKRLIF